MIATDRNNRMEYELPSIHPYYEGTGADDLMVASSVVVLLIGLLLVCF